MKRSLALALFVLSVPTLALAAQAERGFPLLTIYTQQQHGGGGQSSGVVQDTRGLLFFANLHGVLTYDGAWWREILLPNDSAAYAIASNARGMIAAGGVSEFGVIDTAANGAASYRSLVPQLPMQVRDFGDVRSIAPWGGGFLFLTDRLLIAWDGTAPPRAVADLRSRAHVPQRLFLAGGATWLAGDDGLERLDTTTFRIDAPLFPGKRVPLVIDSANGAIVMIADEGLYKLRGTEAEPFAPATSAWLKEKRVTSGCHLADGRLVIATREDGLVILSPTGDIEELIDREAGLPEDVLSAAFADREGSLWLTMDGPLVRIDVSSPVSLLDARTGIKGQPQALLRDGTRLYIGTAYGLYVIEPKVNTLTIAHAAERIESVPGTVWQLVRTSDGTLIAGTSKGLFERTVTGSWSLVPGTADLVFYQLLQSTRDPSLVWAGTRRGVRQLHRVADGWQLGPIIPGSAPYTRFLVEDGTTLWSGSVFNGIVRIDGGGERVQQFGKGEMMAARLDGRLVFGRKGEFLQLSPDGRFVPDPELGMIRVPGGFFHAASDDRGNIWINSRPPASIAPHTRVAQPLVAIAAMNIQRIQAEPGGIIWFSSNDGLFRYERANAAPVPPPPAPVLRVSATSNTLPHGFGRVRIEFGPASYRPGVTYQFRLDPLDDQWSAWSADPFIDYTNLAEGDYTFRIRTRSAGAVSGESRWQFTVLAPWYRTWWAAVLAFVLAAAIVSLIVWLRTRALRRQAEHLRARIAEQTAQLVDKNELLLEANGRLERLSLLDELTGIANRRYFQRALADDWERARERQQPLALIFIDIDHFKLLNDTRGHQAGDACLRRIGGYLGQQIRRSGEMLVRSGDVVARYGGEEFAILLTDTNADQALKTAELLRAGIETLGVTISCGVASVIPGDDISINTLIERADRALYAAKGDGRNCVRAA